MKLREAAQQALEAIDWMRLHLQRDHQCLHMDPAQSGIPAWINKAEIALRAALAEPEHEIIARMRRLRAEAQAEHRRALEQGRCSSCGQELPDELKTEYQVDQDLRNAAMQRLTDIQQEMERSIDSLKAALVEPTVPSDCADSHQPGCDHCNHPLWCGTKCSACGKVWDWGDKE